MAAAGADKAGTFFGKGNGSGTADACQGAGDENDGSGVHVFDYSVCDCFAVELLYKRSIFSK